MCPKQIDETDDEAIDQATQPAGSDTDETPEESPKLNLQVDVASPSACERHVTVTISRDDIDRYFDKVIGELMPTANVPGFRIGRAPRKIVENRYRQEAVEQIKGSLLMDSLSQISDEQEFTAIGEPNLDLDAVEVPKEGPMTFEFTIEVRPEFDLPQWKGLKLKRPMREFTKSDVEDQLAHMLARYGQLVPYDGAAEDGHYLTVNITATHDGRQVAKEQEQVVQLRPTLSFVDGRLEGFGKLMKGANPGDRRQGKVEISPNGPNIELRGKKVDVEFEVLEVKRLKLPELTPDFLEEIGEFKSQEELNEAVMKDLERQLEYQQQKEARVQITTLLTKTADWQLPPALLERQSERELERAVMELRRSGFSDAEIRARENALRQNSSVATATALKEHFILERIAEDEEIDVQESDYEKEIFLIAMQSGESPRRVRAQMEKRGLMDVLRNQIVERKVLERVQQEAKFQDVPYNPEKTDAEAIDMAAGGGSATAIPKATEAKPEAEEVD